MSLFPGKEILESSFFDGVVADYTPTLAEALLGIGGVAVSMALVAIGARMLKVLPDSLEDPEEASA
mgnify:CR=1 FL=1